jgi:hypothetical protein
MECGPGGSVESESEHLVPASRNFDPAGRLRFELFGCGGPDERKGADELQRTDGAFAVRMGLVHAWPQPPRCSQGASPCSEWALDAPPASSPKSIIEGICGVAIAWARCPAADGWNPVRILQPPGSGPSTQGLHPPGGLAAMWRTVAARSERQRAPTHSCGSPLNGCSHLILFNPLGAKQAEARTPTIRVPDAVPFQKPFDPTERQPRSHSRSAWPRSSCGC